MKIVIDISDDLEDKICNATEDWACKYVEGWSLEIARNIRNGTPLPKGHGDLVDRDAVYKAYDYSDIEYTMLNALEDATVIIEADMENKE